jgi:polyferredoxin
MAHGWGRSELIKRALRPRVLVYFAVLGAICLAVGISLFMRTPLKVDVIRDRGALARLVEQGYVENVYRLQLMNATESDQVYAIAVDGLPGIRVASEPEMAVASTQVRAVAVRVQVPPGAAVPGSHPIHFNIRSMDDTEVHVKEKSVFLVPR